MKLSDEGLRLIKSFEGYHTRLKDGSCAAYLCPAGVATIGYGCTEGIKLGMVWTQEQAEEALRREITKFENAVTKSVIVDINQNEFDSMVSLAYNIGVAGFQRSSILRRLNKGDRKGAAQAFHMWNQGGGRVLPGLVSRRAREAALFLKPAEKPEDPFMPQAVAASPEPAKPVNVAAATTAATVVATQVIPGLPLPAVPPEITDSITNVTAWKGIGEQLWTLKDWAASQPMLAGALSVSITGFYLWSKKRATQ